MIQTYVDQVMTEPVKTVSCEATAVEAAKKLNTHGVGSLVVVKDGDAVGILTESDLVSAVAEEYDVFEVKVENLMSSPLVTIETDTKIEEAAERMRDNNIKKLPVTSDGDVVGIVTTTDLSDYIPKTNLVR